MNTGDIPLIGLWISTLHLDLAWSVGDPGQAGKLIELSSSTWLTVGAGIDYSSTDDVDDPSKIRTPLRVMGHRVEWWSTVCFSSNLVEMILSSKSFQRTPDEGRGEDIFTLVDSYDIPTDDLFA